MDTWFDISIASFAFIAAIFWFISAAGTVPKVASDGSVSNDPFYASLQFSASMNRWAALFSCFSALCAAAKVFLLI